MRLFFLLFAGLLLSCAGMAQSIDVDKKSGLVTVDGKEAFYLKAKNKVLWQADYSLENLNNEELAYLKAATEEVYNTMTRKYDDKMTYEVTFTQTGNFCTIRDFTSLSVMKSLAKIIAAARLVENDRVSAEAERKFVVMHNGVLQKDPTIVLNVVNNDRTSKSSGPADISLKENKVYNNGELVAFFKRSTDNEQTLIKIYNADENMIAEARHQDGNEDADWDVWLVNDKKKLTLLYSPSNPLEKLFKYLVEKSYL